MKKTLGIFFLCMACMPSLIHAGPYLGGTLGYGVVNLKPEIEFSIPAASTDVNLDVDFIAQDFLASPVLGFSWQWDRFRLATELQAYWTSVGMVIEDIDPNTDIKISLDQEYVWLLRPAYQLFKNTPLFLYMNAGLARAKIVASPDSDALQAIDFDDYTWGYKLGGGLGYDITPHFTIRVDYIYSQYQSLSNASLQDFGLPEPVMVNVEFPISQSQYLFGVTYNW